MQDEEADDPPPSKEDEIEELKDDLAHSIRWKKTYEAPITISEAQRRARERMGSRATATPLLLIVFAVAAGVFLLGMPPYAIVPILIAALALLYAACLFWELWFSNQSRKAWRAQQARDFDVEIGEIRGELYRLGVREQDLPNELRQSR